MGHYKREFENWVQNQLEPEEQNVGHENSPYWQRVEWETLNGSTKSKHKLDMVFYLLMN